MKKFLTLFILIIIPRVVCMETKYSLYKPQPSAIIYGPWRENYINAQQKPTTYVNKPCTFCTIVSNPDNNKNLILHRGKHSLIMLASQPYIDNGMHFLIVPYEHTRELCDLSSETYHEENTFTQKLCALFASHANETYINSNQGIAAGASIPEHHHKHIMVNHAPRYYNLIDAIQETKKCINLPALFKELQPQMTTLDSITPAQALQNTTHKNCYHCSVIQENMLKNLIIHRGKHATAMISHHPTYFGEIDILPNEHIESLETMPAETYDEINELTTALYPLVLKILHAQDSNIGLISYGDKATHKEHIKQKIIPRKDSWRKTPITRSNHINADVKIFYGKLLSEWHRLLNNNAYRAKL